MYACKHVNQLFQSDVCVSLSLTDINDLNLPKTCTTDFPDSDDLLNFKLIIMPDEGFYKGGRFVFNFKVRTHELCALDKSRNR